MLFSSVFAELFYHPFCCTVSLKTCLYVEKLLVLIVCALFSLSPLEMLFYDFKKYYYDTETLCSDLMPPSSVNFSGEKT